MTMTEARKLAQEMLDGLEGVTPGPWYEGAGWVFVSPVNAETHPSRALRHIFRDVPDNELQPNVAHVARCSPENIALLCRALLDREGA